MDKDTKLLLLLIAGLVFFSIGMFYDIIYSIALGDTFTYIKADHPVRKYRPTQLNPLSIGDWVFSSTSPSFTCLEEYDLFAGGVSVFNPPHPRKECWEARVSYGGGLRDGKVLNPEDELIINEYLSMQGVGFVEAVMLKDKETGAVGLRDGEYQLEYPFKWESLDFLKIKVVEGQEVKLGGEGGVIEVSVNNKLFDNLDGKIVMTYSNRNYYRTPERIEFSGLKIRKGEQKIYLNIPHDELGVIDYELTISFAVNKGDEILWFNTDTFKSYYNVRPEIQKR